MKTKKLFSLVLALWASALSAQTHWQFDYHQYQYEMTLYFELQSNGVAIKNTGNYEVAAFVGNECRGIGTFETQTGSNGTTLSYGFLKVYSNVAQGETVTFKCYDKTKGEEIDISGTNSAFVSSSVIGFPSEPKVFDLGVTVNVLLGDVNGDGFVDLTDAVAIFDYYMGGTTAGFNESAGDFNSDGTVDLTDAVLVFEYYMNQ